jgi:hypothetical protein
MSTFASNKVFSHLTKGFHLFILSFIAISIFLLHEFAVVKFVRKVRKFVRKVKKRECTAHNFNYGTKMRAKYLILQPLGCILCYFEGVIRPKLEIMGGALSLCISTSLTYFLRVFHILAS